MSWDKVCYSEDYSHPGCTCPGYTMAGILILAVVGIPFLFLLFRWFSPAPIEVKPVSAEFKIGDCIQYKSFRERWEPRPLIEKIVEVGERSYRTVSYVDNAWTPERLLLLSPRKGSEHEFNIVTCPN